jgi:hypothetical protein
MNAHIRENKRPPELAALILLSAWQFDRDMRRSTDHDWRCFVIGRVTFECLQHQKKLFGKHGNYLAGEFFSVIGRVGLLAIQSLARGHRN